MDKRWIEVFMVIRVGGLERNVRQRIGRDIGAVERDKVGAARGIEVADLIERLHRRRRRARWKRADPGRKGRRRDEG